MFSNYYQARDWLESFIPQTYSRKNLGLERINYLLKLLDSPQDKFKSIHVGGTSGKGSTAYYISQLLRNCKSEILNPKSETKLNVQNPNSQKVLSLENSNFDIVSSLDISASNLKPIEVGLHLSPHLLYIGERMQINGKAIAVDRLISLIRQIRPIVESMKTSKVGSPSYFEILVAVSFMYFAQSKVDIAVVEVGLGGKYDATNVLAPEVCVITNVGLDHTDILGKEIEKIAQEKAGIIKPKVPIITGATGKALEVIKKEARLASAPLIAINCEPMRTKAKKAPLVKITPRLGVRPRNSDNIRNLIIYKDILRDIRNSLAYHNYLLAITAASVLGASLNRRIIRSAFKKGLMGRFEVIDKGVILDGAHNVDKVKFLIKHLQKKSRYSNYSNNRSELILVISFKKGKDWKKMIDLLIKNLPVKKIIATKFYAVTDTDKFSAVSPLEIRDYLTVNCQLSNVKCFNNSQEAVYKAVNDSLIPNNSDNLRKSFDKTQDVNRYVLITGSLYLVGEARTLWKLSSFA